MPSNTPGYLVSLFYFPVSDRLMFLYEVANAKSETARLAFFFASPRRFYLLKCEAEIYSRY